MTNLEKIEQFLNKIAVVLKSGKNSNEADNLLKIKCLVDVLDSVCLSIGDDKMLIVFKNMVSSLALESEDELMKNLCLRVLNEFNKDLNIQSN